MSPNDPRHGSDAGYSAHLRANSPTCAACKEAHRRSNILRKLYPNRKVLAIGSQRRIQALQWLGYSRLRISQELGYSDNGSIAYLMISETMLASTAERIADLYERLSMTLPEGPGVNRARTWARRHGYAPPLAWDEGAIDDPNAHPYDYTPPKPTKPRRKRRADVDENVVLAVLAGERRDTTPGEKQEIGRRWRAMGKPMAELARLTGWKKPERYGRSAA